MTRGDVVVEKYERGLWRGSGRNWSNRGDLGCPSNLSNLSNLSMLATEENAERKDRGDYNSR